MDQIEEFKPKTWYCHKCRSEAIKRNPKTWYLEKLEYPIEELKEDLNKPKYYLCPKHQTVESKEVTPK